MPSRRCPCGSGLPYADCCGRLHDGTATAATAEQLMRSRYSAFAVGDAAYLLATWHPSTRPGSLDLDDDVRWTGLDVLGTTGGSLLGAEGTVEFRAHHLVAGGRARSTRTAGSSARAASGATWTASPSAEPRTPATGGRRGGGDTAPGRPPARAKRPDRSRRYGQAHGLWDSSHRQECM